MPGAFPMISRSFAYFVPLMVAEIWKVTRWVPFVTTSGPSSVLTSAVLSLMMMAPSSINATGSRWLGCVRQEFASV